MFHMPSQLEGNNGQLDWLHETYGEEYINY